MEKHRNADGTYDGVGVLAEASGLSREEVLSIAERAKANSYALSSCQYHEFVATQALEPTKAFKQRYRCRYCGGEIDAHAYYWHEQGRRARP